MQLNEILHNRGLVKIVLCRWGLILAVVGYFVLFMAELTELVHEPDEVKLMKAFGYGVLLGVVTAKAYKVLRTGRFFGAASETPSDIELH